MTLSKDNFQRIARLAVTAMIHPGGLGMTAGKEGVSWLVDVLSAGERKTVDRLVKSVRGGMEEWAAKEGARDGLEWGLLLAEEILKRHALDVDDLHDADLEAEKAVRLVWERSRVEERDAGVRDVATKAMESAYETLLGAPDQVEALTAGFRRAVLRRLREGGAEATADAVREALLPALVRPGWRFWRSSFTPSSLLRAEYKITPFRYRQEELDDLDEWCEDGKDIGIRLYHGPGGMGKTRLMLEACSRRNRQDWRAGFLDEEAAGRLMQAKAFDALFQGPKPLFLVVDYAERRRDTLPALLRPLTDYLPSRPVRVVLLARSSEDWWKELRRTSDLLQGSDTQEMLPIRPWVVEAEEREARFREAAAAFTRRVKEPHDLQALPDFTDPIFDRALFLHVAALNAVLGGDPRGTADELLDFLYDREQVQLAKLIKEQGIAPSLHAVSQAAALATLSGPLVKESEARKVLRRAPLLADSTPDEVSQVVRLLHSLYPSTNWLNGVQPDLLGEHWVAKETEEDDELLVAALGGGAEAERRVRALEVLTAWAQRRASSAPEGQRGKIHDEALARLRKALEVDLPTLAEPAMKVAMRVGDPIGLALAEALEAAGDAELAERLDRSMPKVTTALLEAAEVVTRLQRDAVRAADSQDEESRIKFAGLSNDLSVRLAGLGHREAALEAIEEAVKEYRELASSRPEPFAPNLAKSLNNLSTSLSELGRREAALEAIEEAVEVYRELASSCPEAFAPDLAMSLNNLSVFLSDLGRREAALEAIEEAVAIRRDLASSRPEAFAPDLATSLNNLSNCLSALGRREAALGAIEEAVAIRRELASSRPEAFAPALARSLNNLAKANAELGRREAALEAIEEAVVVYRELASSRPEAFAPALAMSLNNLSNGLSDLGRREAALEAIEEAVRIFSPFVVRHPAAFADRARIMAGNYVKRAEDAGVEPDVDLLRPIQTTLATLESDPTAD